MFTRLGSVAGPVIQATGRSEFEDGLGSGDFVSGYSCHMSVVMESSLARLGSGSSRFFLILLKKLEPKKSAGSGSTEKKSGFFRFK
jgi:hypothetical protein